MLSTELWKVILKKLRDDPVELTRMQLVCRSWRDLIDEFLPSCEKWKELACNEVSYFWLADEKERSYQIGPFMDCTMPVEDICSLYVTWKEFQLEMVPKKLKASELYQITCTATIHDIVAVGWSNGTIYFSHIAYPEKPFFIGKHDVPVTAIEFFRLPCITDDNDDDDDDGGDDDILYTIDLHAASMHKDGSIKHWNVLERREISSVSDGHLGQFLAQGYTGFGGFSMWKGYVFKHRFSAFLEKVEHSQPFVLALNTTEEVVAVGDNPNDSILLLTLDGGVTTRYYLEDSRIAFIPVTSWYEHQGNRVLPDELVSCNAKKFFIFTENVTVCLADKFLALSIQNRPWTVHNMLDKLGERVTCVYTDALISFDPDHISDHMVLGTESGVAYVYKIRDVSDWLDFDLSSLPKRTVTVSNDPIISLNCGSTKYKISSPDDPVITRFLQYYLVAATATKAVSIPNIFADEFFQE